MSPPLQMTWQQQHHHRRTNTKNNNSSSPPLGLKNLGNTCYLNSVLQCLSFTPPLAQFCLSSLHSSLCKSLLPNNNTDCPFCILERHVTRSLTLDSPPFAPSKIHKSLALFSPHFRWGRQEDAHEFLRYVIDACHNATLKLNKLDGNNTTATIMKEIFGGELLSQVKCGECRAESNKTDEIMDISLDLFGSGSVDDALARFFQVEVLDGNNKYSCGKCKKLSVAKKQMFVLRAPNVLVVQLKRFEGIHGGKINRNIEFEEVLLLSKFMASTSQDSQPEYNLFGSIVHSGYSPESGHYYAYIKDPFGRWYCCNDAHVSLSSTQEVLSEKVYILFYLRSNHSPRSSKTGSSCNGQPGDANGSEISLPQKSSELLKPQTARANGVLSSKNNVSTVLKNGKISPNSEIKPINFKNVELKRVISNGNGKLVVHNNASIEKNGFVKQSSAVKKNIASPANGSVEENKFAHKVESPSASNSCGANGNSSVMFDHGINQISHLQNGNGYSNLLKVKEDSASQSLEAAKRELDSAQTSNDMINGNNSSILASKRKSCETERDEGLNLFIKKSCQLSRNDDSCKPQITCLNHSPEELEKFKEEIAAEVRSKLRSCGYVDTVHSFMRTRKRLYTQASGSCPDGTDIRQQMKIDAKKNYLSQIPESLKEHLIGRLRSFSQEKPFLDT